MVFVNKNIAALGAQRRLSDASSRLQESFSRLSSGLRIIRAKDDAAGLSIAVSLATDKRIYLQGVRNINDGISLLNIAEGTASELKNILFRIRELSTQASNGTIGTSQRQSLNQESELLIEEYNRILDTSEFNGIGLFSDKAIHIRIQAGYGTQGEIPIGLGFITSGRTSSPEEPTYVGDGTFGDHTMYGAGSQVRAVSVGDFNGDGILDLVSANASAPLGKLRIRLGNGDGTFGAQTSYDVGRGAQSVSVGDFNGDGILDLVSANTIQNNLSVLLGNGDGTFGAHTTYSVGSSPRSVSVGDFNGDGILDLVSANSSGTLSVLLGNGDGTFGAQTTYSVGSNPQSVSIGDFNGDGILDLVSANSGSDNLSVLLGNGDGTFGSQSTHAVGTIAFSVSVGDFNDDGVLDLVAANTSGTLSVLLGNGDGTFGTQDQYAVEPGAYSVSVGDFNGDGVLDLVSANLGDSTLSVLLGNGDGTFGAQQAYSVGNSPQAVSVGDFNGDGVLDLVSANNGNSSLSVLLGNSTTVASSEPYEQEVNLVLLEGIDLSIHEQALASQSVIDGYLEELNLVFGKIGGGAARLESAARKLMLDVETLTAAESQIRDVDVATESAELIRNQILQQASAAVLGQANLQPELVLKLLSFDRDE